MIVVPARLLSNQQSVPFLSPLTQHEYDVRRRHEEHMLRSVLSDVLRKEKQCDSSSRLTASRTASKEKFSIERLNGEDELELRLEQELSDQLLTTTQVSLFFNATSVANVFSLISNVTQLNFVVDSDIASTKLSLRLRNVVLADALRVLCEQSNPTLAVMFDSGVYRVMTHRKAITSMKRRMFHRRGNDIWRHTAQLKNVQLTQSLKLLIEKMWCSIVGGRDAPQSYLVIDEGSKKIFMRGRRRCIEEFKTYLQGIDVRLAQVKIEARVVLAQKDFEEHLGLQLSGLCKTYSNRRGFNTAQGGSDDGALPRWSLNLMPQGALDGRANLPLIFGGSSLATRRLNILLSAAENQGEVRTILKPSILTNHGEESEILVGDSVPIETVVKESAQGTLRDVTTAQYRDVGTKLKVRPLVSSDNKNVFLDIFVESSSHMAGGKFPLITATRSKSKVVLRSGQTTMISGLIENSRRRDVASIPLLSNVPVIGWLFRGKRRVLKDHQLLIFITPTIVVV